MWFPPPLPSLSLSLSLSPPPPPCLMNLGEQPLLEFRRATPFDFLTKYKEILY